jgi:hypothetical protein
MRTPRLDDSGSQLLLQMLLIVITLAAVSVIADVGRVIGARQSLAATADQAAVAGAQAIDFAAYYSRGADASGVLLASGDVEAAVRRYIAPAVAAGQQEDLELAAVEVDDEGVTVRLRCRALLPFASLLGVDSVPVRASARAALVVRP